jgi:hypothetical protein
MIEIRDKPVEYFNTRREMEIRIKLIGGVRHITEVQERIFYVIK